MPYAKRVEDLKAALSDGSTVIHDKDLYMLIYQEENILQRYKDMRDKYWGMIKDAVTQEPYIFQSSFRRKKAREIAEKYEVSELSIINSFKRYWKRGKIPNALLPDYVNCGGRGKEKAVGAIKRGRPKTHTDILGEGVNITDEIKKIFTISINRFYYTTAKFSLVRTYEMMRKEYFVDEYKTIEGVKIPVIKPQGETPTFGQFRYWFEKKRDIKKEITSRLSNKKFQKSYRAITGNATDGVMQPGEVEIDAQVLDFYVVSRYNRTIIGRPVFFSVIDKFSRIICGMYVGLEQGSYASAMMALHNTTTDKVAFCKQYGITIKEEDWPVHFLPQKIIADNGEISGLAIDNLINMLNIQVSFAPVKRPDLKTFVEYLFKELGDYIKPHIPGTIDLNNQERGDYDYRLQAKLDLYSVNKVIIKAIIYHNNHHVLKNYKRDELMIADDVPLVPRDIFNWGVANRGGLLRSVSDDVIKLALMPSEEATVTAKGIRFKDIYYTSKRMLKENIFVDARKKTWKVKISYDPRDLSNIYMHGDTPQEYEKCFMIDKNSRYRDKMIEEIEHLQVMEKLQIEKMKDSEAQAKAQLITEIEHIVKEAKKEYAKEFNSSESDKKRVENISGNRSIEKAANRVTETFVLDDEETNYIETNYTDDDLDPLELLVERQKEGLQNGR